MGLENSEILLDNQYSTYYAGQTINGQVKLVFDKVKKVRGIHIRFLGEANTEWDKTEYKTSSDNQRVNETVTYKGHEEYFQIQYYLLGGKNSAETELPPGTHMYPFSCSLPPMLPSSFEGEHGHVRYTIKVTLDRPWKFDQDMKMAFTVIAPVDLNLNPRVKEPYRLELEKTFCCFCCRSGPLSVSTFIPVTGYVSGQTIPITCECDNASKVGIDEVRFVLRKRVTFTTTQPSTERKESKIEIAKLAVGPVGPNDSQTFNQQFMIPSLPPTNLINCGIISLDYDLHVVAVVTGPHVDLKGNIPITLGTIPLSSFKPPAPYTDVPADKSADFSQASTQPASPVVPPVPIATGGAIGWNVADSANGAVYPHLPPPQFVATEFKAPNIAGHGDTQYTQVVGDASFAPRYPVFQFSPTAPPPPPGN